MAQEITDDANPDHLVPSAADDNGLVTFGCCVRFDRDFNEGPRIHSNAAHINIGVESVGRETGYLVVNFDRSVPVVSTQVNTDETMAGGRGIIAGVSGGVGKIRIRLHDTRINQPVSPTLAGHYTNRLQGSGANLWVLVVGYDASADKRQNQED